MNGFPTTNGQARSSAIHRTFQHYRINKLNFMQPRPLCASRKIGITFWLLHIVTE